jgi:hypothetical protein
MGKIWGISQAPPPPKQVFSVFIINVLTIVSLANEGNIGVPYGGTLNL